MVLMTEARSQDQVAGPARFARARELLLLGVGSEAVRAELEEVTGSPERVMIYAGLQDLFGQIPKLRGMLCISSAQFRGCQAQSLDLVFMLDASASVGPEDFAQMQSFVRSCALRFDVSPDVTQMGLVVYGGRVQTAFGLDPRRCSTAGQEPGPLPGWGCGGGHGWEGAEGVTVPAQKLRDNGVSVLVMGVRPVLREALRRLTGPRDSLIHVAAYADLRHHRDTFIEWICREAKRPVNLCTPSPCVSEGTCVLHNGSYLCKCRDGREGPHCESPLSGTLLPTLLTQGEERAQLQTLLPRDAVAADFPPNDDVENSSG
ncbi:von Willebrand factor A domain-containing protein 2, partial [Eschrichtius robustus]|nr:von Willebrand factor A domain-containing protein 2 [Eschrichtius robustus]